MALHRSRHSGPLQQGIGQRARPGTTARQILRHYLTAQRFRAGRVSFQFSSKIPDRHGLRVYEHQLEVSIVEANGSVFRRAGPFERQRCG